MKKLSLLLVVLLAAGSAGLYGQMAIGTNFSISGSATATAGYDIDDEQFGFKNESSANIKIVLVAKQSTNNSEMVDMSGGWYGSIELNDFQIVIDSDNEEDSTEFVQSAMPDPGTDDAWTTRNGCNDRGSYTKLYVVEPTIVATLKNGPLWLRIFDAPRNARPIWSPTLRTTRTTTDYEAEGNDDGKDVGVDLRRSGHHGRLHHRRPEPRDGHHLRGGRDSDVRDGVT